MHPELCHLLRATLPIRKGDVPLAKAAAEALQGAEGLLPHRSFMVGQVTLVFFLLLEIPPSLSSDQGEILLAEAVHTSLGLISK